MPAKGESDHKQLTMSLFKDKIDRPSALRWIPGGETI